MDKIFQKVVTKQIEALIEEKIELENTFLNFTPKWFEPNPIEDPAVGAGSRKSKNLGIYKIIYGPTDEVMYIGQGIISGRKSKHIMVFRNKGEPIVRGPGKANTDSPAARKMYNFDDNIDNWLFSFCIVDNKALCQRYEDCLIKNEDPEFNSPGMSGCN